MNTIQTKFWLCIHERMFAICDSHMYKQLSTQIRAHTTIRVWEPIHKSNWVSIRTLVCQQLAENLK